VRKGLKDDDGGVTDNKSSRDGRTLKLPLSVSRTGLASVEPHRYSNPVPFFNGERVGGL
jgi:hypothetical protein